MAAYESTWLRNVSFIPAGKCTSPEKGTLESWIGPGNPVFKLLIQTGVQQRRVVDRAVAPPAKTSIQGQQEIVRIVLTGVSSKPSNER